MALVHADDGDAVYDLNRMENTNEDDGDTDVDVELIFL